MLVFKLQTGLTGAQSDPTLLPWSLYKEITVQSDLSSKYKHTLLLVISNLPVFDFFRYQVSFLDVPVMSIGQLLWRPGEVHSILQRRGGKSAKLNGVELHSSP